MMVLSLFCASSARSCNVASATTAGLTAPSQGVYDIEYTQTSTGAVTRAFEGSYYVTPEATK